MGPPEVIQEPVESSADEGRHGVDHTSFGEVKARILIVEDNLYSSYALTSILDQYQIKSEVALNGQEAINSVKQRF